MLEDARSRAGRGEGAQAAHAGLVDDDQFAGLDIALVGRADDIERDAFAGEDHRIAKLAHDERANAERIAARDQSVGGQHEERISTLDLAERIGQAVERGGVGRGRDEVDDDFGVTRRLEDRAAADERGAQAHRVRQIAVVRDRKAAVGEFGEQRLDVADRGLAGGRITHVADRHASRQLADDVVLVEIARDMPHRAVGMEVIGVEAGDPGGFLPAMLERVEPERDEARGALGIPDSEDAALLAQLVVIEWVGRQHGWRESISRG